MVLDEIDTCIILMNGSSFPDLLNFIRSASAWVILLKSSSSLNSIIEMLFDTPSNTKYTLSQNKRGR